MRPLVAVLILMLAAVAAGPTAAAIDPLCLPGANGGTCVVAHSYRSGGEGSCDGAEHSGGMIGVQRHSGDTHTFAGVMNQCYTGHDPNGGAYGGSTLGVYFVQVGPDGWRAEGLHVNTGASENHGEYCWVGEPDPVAPRGRNCPTVARVPVVLSSLP